MKLINEFNTIQNRHPKSIMSVKDIESILCERYTDWPSIISVENIFKQNNIKVLRSGPLLVEVETAGEERFTVFLSKQTNKNNSSYLTLQRITKAV